MARQEQTRLDPVTSRVADLLHIARDTINLTVAIVFGLLLECPALGAWLPVLPDRSSGIEGVDASAALVPRVVARRSAVAGSREVAQVAGMLEVASHEPVAEDFGAVTAMPSGTERESPNLRSRPGVLRTGQCDRAR